MSKIVIAGASDCARYAKIELLADEIARNTPNFRVHKIVVQTHEWKAWTNELNKRNGWRVNKSPVVWRELVDRGGKGALIGSANEFLEYAATYYGVRSLHRSDHLKHVAADNVRLKQASVMEFNYLRSLSNPMRVCVTSASHPTAYHLLPLLASGDIFGRTTQISLIMYDNGLEEGSSKLQNLKGVQMELLDLAYPLLRSITISDDLTHACENCQFVIIVNDLQDTLRDLNEQQQLQAHVDLMKYYAGVMDEACARDCKILVVNADEGNAAPLCLCVYHLQNPLQRLSGHNVVGLSRDLERRAKAQLAKKLTVNSSDIVDVIVWGDPTVVTQAAAAASAIVKSPNPSTANRSKKSVAPSNLKCFADISGSRVFQFQGAISGPEEFHQELESTIWDKKWVKKEWKSQYEQRFYQILDSRSSVNASWSRTPAMSLAHAVATCLHDWVQGHYTSRKEMFSLCVASQGWYNVPEKMVFSFPVRFHPPGNWTVVEDFEVTSERDAFIAACVKAQQDQWLKLYPPEELDEFQDPFGDDKLSKN